MRKDLLITRIASQRQADTVRRLSLAQERILTESIARLRVGWAVGIGRIQPYELCDETCGYMKDL